MQPSAIKMSMHTAEGAVEQPDEEAAPLPPAAPAVQPEAPPKVRVQVHSRQLFYQVL